MTDTLGSAASTAKGAAQNNPLTDAARSEAADRLKSEVQDYLAAQAQRMLSGVGRKLGETTGKLNDIASGDGPGLARLALDSGRKLAEGKGPVRSALELGASRGKDKVVGAVKNLGGGGKGKKKRGAGQKPTVIMEYVDVGVPVRTAYDQWTQYQEFSTFAKGVKNAERRADDDTESDWQLQVLWSGRSWKATTTEQVPDERIAWNSEGSKGTTKGVVSFHRLADRLTRVVVVIEYYPSGLFEKTGNIWRAQGRRTRLDLKNFARHITLKGEAEDSWRGEIRDSEVVRSHEDAIAEEENEEAEGEDETENEDGTEDEEDAPYGEEGDADEEYDEPDEEDGEDEDAAEDAYEDDDEEDDTAEDADEDAYAERGSRR